MSLHHAPHIQFGQQAYRQALQRMLLCLAFLSCAIAGNAQNVTRPNILSPSGIQVNSYTGSLYFQRSDFSIPSRGMDIDISFAYNSAYRNRDWGYGAGWTFNYNIFYLPDSAATGITIYQGDGRQDYYRVSGNNFTQPKGIFTTLTQYQPGKYRLTMKDGSRYDFDDTSHKKLTRITDRYGNKLIFTYTGRQLTGITDSLGHLMTLSWTAANRLDEVKAQAGSETRSVRYTYDTLGMLKQVRRPLGVTMNYVYGPNKGLSGYIDPNGNGTGIFYNSSNAVVKIVSCQLEQRITYNPDQHKTYLTELNDGNTLSTTYEFDAQGRLIHKAGNCCGYDTKYEYDADNNISKTTDGNGGTKLFTYDANGNVLGETDQGGSTSLTTYGPVSFSHATSATDKKGNQTQYTYDAQGNLTSMTNALNQTQSYTYNTFGQKLSETDRKGYQTKYIYDSYGYLSMTVGPIDDTTIYLNDGWGNVLQQTDPLRHTTVFEFDSLNRMTAMKNAMQYTSRFSYDYNGNRVSSTDANGRTTKFIYNWRNKNIVVTDPLNRQTVLGYDGKGNMLTQSDATGNTKTLAYDNLNRLLSETNGADETTNYEYDGIGNNTGVTTPNGNTRRMKYDALNRISEISDVLGVISKYTYDANFNILTKQDGKGNTITYRYDALNRVTATTDALGNNSITVYDANGNTIQQTDREGHSTSYTYDLLNRQTTVTDALNHTTATAYDKAGNVTSITDANGNITRYTYNAINQLVQEKFADNTTKTYTYDSVGNQKTYTDNMGQTTTYVYDAVNKPILRIFAPGVADSFTYNVAGLMTNANRAGARISYAYDRANRPLSESLNGKVTTYTYNTATGKKTTTYPGGRSIEQIYNGRDKLTTILEAGGQVIATFEYDAAGQNTKRMFRNGTVTNLSFDGNGQVTALNHNPARFVDFGYSYDKEGNTAVAQFNHRSSHTEQYSYDHTYQLTGYNKGGNPAGAFSYDGVSNRVTATLHGGTASYTVNSMNAYSNIVYSSTVTPVYDNNGNLTGNGSTTYTYDRENRIIAVNSGTTARYNYDAFGRRIRKISAGDTVNYYFSGVQVIEERNGKDSLQASYIWGRWIDDIVSMQRGGQNYYYHTNTVGSVISVTNAAGTVVERYDYDAFGKAAVYNGDFSLLTGGTMIGNPYLYTGREYDTETGNYYYRARYYDAVHGRFMQRDPIGYEDGMGIYTYVQNKPIILNDPSGLKSCKCEDDFYGELSIISAWVKGNSFLDGHAWIKFTTKNKIETWDNMPGAGGRYNEVTDKKIGIVKRTKQITKSQYANLKAFYTHYKTLPILEQYSAGGQIGGVWIIPPKINCSSFASQMWQSATGEHLSPYGWVSGYNIPSPEALSYAITAANSNSNQEDEKKCTP